jgi:hypothetical protein
MDHHLAFFIDWDESPLFALKENHKGYSCIQDLSEK